MSYANVADIGAGAVVGDVEAAARVIDNILGYNGLYEPSSTWSVPQDASQSQYIVGFYNADGTYVADLQYQTMEITNLEMFYGSVRYPQMYYEDTTTHTVGTRNWQVPKALSENYIFPNGALMVTGVRGNATLVDLSVGTTCRAGETTVRNGVATLHESQYTSVAGDQLAKPPELLRRIAITIARRIIRLESDQDAVWSDDRAFNSLTDGFYQDLIRFR